MVLHPHHLPDGAVRHHPGAPDLSDERARGHDQHGGRDHRRGQLRHLSPDRHAEGHRRPRHDGAGEGRPGRCRGRTVLHERGVPGHQSGQHSPAELLERGGRPGLGQHRPVPAAPGVGGHLAAVHVCEHEDQPDEPGRRAERSDGQDQSHHDDLHAHHVPVDRLHRPRRPVHLLDRPVYLLHLPGAHLRPPAEEGL